METVKSIISQSRTNKVFSGVIKTFLLLSVFCGAGQLLALDGPVAWVTPDPKTRTLVLDTYSDSAVLSVIDPKTGEDVNSPEGLYKMGWIITPDGLLASRMDGFYETIPLHEMGKALKITVKNLYPGQQKVAVQYFSQPLTPTSSWGFYGTAWLDGQDKKTTLATKGKLVRGLGSYDQRSLYEESLPSSEDAKETSDVSFTIQRAKWAKLFRVSGILIETKPSLTASTTGLDTPHNNAIRKKLNALSEKQKSKNISYKAAVLPSTVKVKPKTFASIRPEQLEAQADLAACRGERESFQILLYDKSNPIKDLKWSVHEIKDQKGVMNSDIHVSVIPVGYVKQMQDPSETDTYGYMPDALLDYMDTLTVAPGDAQTLWVRFKISPECKPGDYSGKVVLSAKDNDTCGIPFKLKVWNISMPKMPFFPLITGGGTSEFAQEYGFNLGGIYYTTLLDSLERNKEKTPMEQLKRWKQLGASAVNLGYTTGEHGGRKGRLGMTYEDPLPDEKELNAWLDRVGEGYDLAKKAGLKDQCYIYMFDETKHNMRAGMKVVSAAIRKRWPDLRQCTTARGFDAEGKNYEFGRDDNLEIDTWIPGLAAFRNSELGAIAKAKGRHIWWYTTQNPKPRFPNAYVNNYGMETRMLFGVLPHAYGVGGYLVSSICHPSRVEKLQGGPYLTFELADKYEYGYRMLYYMSKDKTPIASIRLENIKDGLEDYNLIAIAKAYQQALKNAGKDVDLPAAKLIPDLFKVPNPYVKNILDYCRDPEKLEALRRDLADYIIRARSLYGRDIAAEEIRKDLE